MVATTLATHTLRSYNDSRSSAFKTTEAEKKTNILRIVYPSALFTGGRRTRARTICAAGDRPIFRCLTSCCVASAYMRRAHSAASHSELPSVTCVVSLSYLFLFVSVVLVSAVYLAIYSVLDQCLGCHIALKVDLALTITLAKRCVLKARTYE